MKFSINKNILLSNLQFISKATPLRSTIPIISSAMFVVKNSKLKIRATDLEISISSICNVEDSQDGSIAIPVSKLLEIANAMPNEEIKFDVSDIGKVNIESSFGNYTIMGQSSEEFPTEQVLENSQKLVLTTKILKEIIASTLYATSSDDLKPVLQGVLLQIMNGKIISVSTDGHRLVKFEKKNINNLDYRGNIVIPSKFLSLINSQNINEQENTILIGDNHIQIEFNNNIISSRIIKDPFPDYESVIPKENSKTLIVDKNIFLDAIKRVSIFSNKASKQISLELSENNIIISTEDPENITTGKETIDCNYDGDSMVIGYNALYLKEVLQNQKEEEIKILLNTPLNAGLFVSNEQSEETKKITLLMPIRLND